MKKIFSTFLFILFGMTMQAQVKSGLDLCLRDEQTGEWLIGLFDKFVVYDCEYWDYKEVKNDADKIDVTVANGCELLRIVVGKEKNGKRPVTIGGGKKRICSSITSEYLPDYPTKDVSAFKDNNYRQGDTVIFMGWMKDFPKQVLDRLPEFEVSTAGLFSRSELRASARIDSLGRFCVKVPVENTQQVYMDWRRSHVVTVLEPGETYFFFQDAKNHRRLMMGRNARVQNELLAHEIDQEFNQAEQGGMTPEQAIAYKNQWVGMLERNMTKLDSVLVSSPTLSKRYEDYQRSWMVCQMGEQVMQSMFYAQGRVLPDEVVDDVTERAWTKMQSPYTLIRDFSWFIYYYLLQANERNPKYHQQNLSPEAMWNMEKEGLLSFTDEDHELIRLWQQRNQDYKGADDTDYPALDEKYKGLQERIVAFIQREDVAKVIAGKLDPLKVEMQTIDSVCSDPVLRDICKARVFYQRIDETRVPLSEEHLAIVNALSLPAAKDAVITLNDHYVTLQKQAIANAASIRPSSDVEGLTDGEAIFRKITEPYKGRLVYLDVWGTWCSPCKKALKESHKLKEALKDYDIVYLYLCNRSSDESWKNVIKEYNLMGENCIHYNLPSPQQSAVESFLNVHSFPTYKLIDKEGNIHDLDWRHADDLNSFKATVKQFK